MSDAALILVEGPDESGIATLTLNRPEKKNALSIALRDALTDQLDRLAVHEELKVLLITGNGDTFSAGFDLKEFAVDDPSFQDRLWASSDRYHHAVVRFPLPIIAVVNGAALAGGFDLAVLCDLRIAAASARFAHPEQRFGDVVYGPLHDLVGGAIARDLCFTGRPIDADEALRLGIVSQVVPDRELAASAMRLAGEVARAPRPSLLRTKAKAVARARIASDSSTLDF